MKCVDCKFEKVCDKNKTSPVKGCKSGTPLRKCPFCGKYTSGIVRSRTIFLKEKVYVVCTSCGARTDKRYNIEEVVKLWNTRK